MIIPERSSVHNFWVVHPIGYPKYAIEDEEEKIDGSFLESPEKDANAKMIDDREGESEKDVGDQSEPKP